MTPTHGLTDESKSGWLWLEVRRFTWTTWMEYYFVLDEGILCWYDDAGSHKSLGHVEVSSTEVSSCAFARTSHFAFRISQLSGKGKFILAAETEKDSLDWAESLIAHGATGLLRSLTVKPKVSMSFRPRLTKQVDESNHDSERATSRFKSFGRAKPPKASAAPVAATTPPEGLMDPQGEAIGRRRKGVHFEGERSPKRLSVGDH